MKSFLYLSLIFCFISCKKDDETSPPAPNGTFEADVFFEGTNTHWNLHNASITKQYLSGDTLINISAAQDDKGIFISLHDIYTSGSYRFGTQPGFGGQKAIVTEFVKEDNSGSIWSGDHYFSDFSPLNGAIDITIDNLNNISGAFSVKCWMNSDSVVISNGKFSGAIK